MLIRVELRGRYYDVRLEWTHVALQVAIPWKHADGSHVRCGWRMVHVEGEPEVTAEREVRRHAVALAEWAMRFAERSGR